MKTAAPRVSAESVSSRRDLRRNVLRSERRVGRGRPRTCWMARSKRLCPNASAIPALLTASRTVTRTPRQTGTSAAASGTSSPTPTSSAITPGGAKNVVEVEVHEACREDRQPVGAEGAQRQRHAEREHRVGQDHPEVQHRHLPVPGAHRLHHADLAGLLGDDGVDGVDDEEARCHEGEEAEEAEDEEDPGEQIVGGMLAGRGDEHEDDARARPLHPLPDGLREGADAVAGERRVGDEDPELVIRRPISEVGQRLERDVPVQAADVEGGGGADLVGEPGDAQPVERAVHGLDLHRAGGRDVGQGEARALQEKLAAAGRPHGSGLGRHEVQALVLEVGDRGEL